jgi:hypothetical protein
MPWSAAVSGWPSVAAAATFLVVGLSLKRSWLAFAGAIAAIPFCILVSGYPIPIGRFGGPTALLANFASVWLLHRRQYALAFGLIVPFMIIAAVFAALVVGQGLPLLER